MPTVRANGIDIYYEVRGEGEPLLMIQGTGVDHTLWNGQFPAYAEAYRCILMDNRGAGRSDKPHDGYTVANMADDAAGLLDALGIESAHVAGLSLGSAIAQELALRHPQKVRSLGLHATWDRTADWPYVRRHFELRRSLVQQTDYATHVAGGQLLFYTPEYVNEHDAELLQVQQRTVSYEFRPPVHGIVGHFDADLGHDTRDRLGQIRVPTLITVGEQDHITPPFCARAVHARIPGSDLHIWPATGHVSCVQVAEEFNRYTLDWMARRARG